MLWVQIEKGFVIIASIICAIMICVLPDRCGIKDNIDKWIKAEHETPPLKIHSPRIDPIDIFNGNNKPGFTIKGNTGQSHMDFSGGKSYGSGINVPVPVVEGKLMECTPQGYLNHTNFTQIANPFRKIILQYQN